MKFLDFINELFDKPFKFKRKVGTQNSVVYSFISGNADFKIIVYHITGKQGDGLEVIFQKNGSEGIDPSDEPFRVFATVKEALYDSEVEYKDYVTFGAKSDEPSRVSLYNKFAKLVKKELKFEDIEINKSGRYVEYTIWKNKDH